MTEEMKKEIEKKLREDLELTGAIFARDLTRSLLDILLEYPESINDKTFQKELKMYCNTVFMDIVESELDKQFVNKKLTQ